MDERTHVETLWPPAGRTDLNLNDTSLVLRITCDGQSVLLTGDLARVGQSELARAPPAVRADVLVLPHHGAWHAPLPGFVSAVSPEIVVVSAAADPAGRLGPTERAEEFFANLAASAQYYTTAGNGWTCIRFGAGRVRVECMRP